MGGFRKTYYQRDARWRKKEVFEKLLQAKMERNPVLIKYRFK